MIAAHGSRLLRKRVREITRNDAKRDGRSRNPGSQEREIPKSWLSGFLLPSSPFRVISRDFADIISALCRALAVLLIFSGGPLFSAEEKLPPAPTNYFNDYAGLVPPVAAQRLDDRLRQFERETSNQIVVAIFPKLETQSSIADYCQRVFVSWKVGQAKLDNGAVFFVFAQEHKTWIQTGRGLEGALPDATCRRILDEEVKPAFRAGDYAAGVSAAVEAMIKATRGEYKGSGRVAGDSTMIRHSRRNPGSFWVFGLIAFFLIARVLSAFGNRGTVFGGRSRSSGCGWMMLPMLMGSWGGGSSSSWGSSSGGFSSGGGGGFSGGGGDSGGGGAGGDW